MSGGSSPRTHHIARGGHFLRPLPAPCGLFLRQPGRVPPEHLAAKPLIRPPVTVAGRTHKPAPLPGRYFRSLKAAEWRQSGGRIRQDYGKNRSTRAGKVAILRQESAKNKNCKSGGVAHMRQRGGSLRQKTSPAWHPGDHRSFARPRFKRDFATPGVRGAWPASMKKPRQCSSGYRRLLRTTIYASL